MLKLVVLSVLFLLEGAFSNFNDWAPGTKSQIPKNAWLAALNEKRQPMYIGR